MRIGVWLPIDYNPESGGRFSYFNKLVHAIDEYEFDNEIEIIFITMSLQEMPFKKKVKIISSLPKQLYILKEIFQFSDFLLKLFNFLDKENIKRKNGKVFKDAGIDIIYYLQQREYYFPDIPFIATNWDIGHCSTFPFPEITVKSEHKRRTYYYQNILPCALMIFADSESGKQELLKYTVIGEHKINVIPIFSGNVSRIQMRNDMLEKTLLNFGLCTNKYFFYPAQFWAHKNHFGLISAFKSFLNNHKDYRLVLCGSDKGNLKYIQNTVQKFGLSDSILFLGFISNEEMYALYYNATALIMASWFGPTNMPPIEAIEIGCPVICSNITGHHEILGDAALYFDPFDDNSLCDAMNEMACNHDEYKRRINDRNLNSIFKIENSIKLINQGLKKAVTVRRNWL